MEQCGLDLFFSFNTEPQLVVEHPPQGGSVPPQCLKKQIIMHIDFNCLFLCKRGDARSHPTPGTIPTLPTHANSTPYFTWRSIYTKIPIWIYYDLRKTFQHTMHVILSIGE